MMKKFKLTSMIAAASILLTCAAGQADAMQVSFMGRLANFQGVVDSLWSKIAVDKERTEVFTLNPRKRDVRIFNETGMEVFAFGDNIEVSGASDIDLGEDGNIYLVYPRVKEYKILRLDYKGEPLAYIDLKEFPEDFQEFQPSYLQYMDGRLYMADAGAMDVVFTDIDGVFQKGFHLKEALHSVQDEFKGRPGEEDLTDPEKFKFIDMAGFCVDRDENIYFTVSTLFAAFKMPADGGELTMFGKAGSGPGKFGVIAGITTDSEGKIYITDRLRSVVMIFDARFKFLTEFGYRGVQPGRLIVPDDVVVNDRDGLIYVAQAALRGVSVYRIVED